MRTSRGSVVSLRQRRSCWSYSSAVWKFHRERASALGQFERTGQAPGLGPADEGGDHDSLGRVAGEPEVELRLGQGGQLEFALVEPGQEPDGGLDVVDVSTGGTVGVAVSGRAAAGVADHVPLGERPDDHGLVAGQHREGAGHPSFQPGEVFVAFGQDAGDDQEGAGVPGGGALREGVEQFVGERLGPAGELGEGLGGGASAQPAQHGVGVFRAGQGVGHCLQVVRDGVVVSAEKITDPLAQDAAGALTVVEEITGLAAPAAACAWVVSAAGGAQVAAVGRAADHDAPVTTGGAGSRRRTPGLVAARADGSKRPGGLGAPVVAAQPAGTDGTRPAGTAVESSAPLTDLTTVAPPAADAALALRTAVAADADLRLPVGGTHLNLLDLATHAALAFRPLVAGAADRTRRGPGIDLAVPPAADTLPLGPRGAVAAQRRPVLGPVPRRPHPVTPRALRDDQRIAAVAAPADRPVLAAGDDLVNPPAAPARAEVHPGPAPATTAPFRGALGGQRIRAPAANARHLRDRLPMPGCVQHVPQPDHTQRPVDHRNGQPVGRLLQITGELPDRQRPPPLRLLDSSLRGLSRQRRSDGLTQASHHPRASALQLLLRSPLPRGAVAHDCPGRRTTVRRRAARAGPGVPSALLRT